MGALTGALDKAAPLRLGILTGTGARGQGMTAGGQADGQADGRIVIVGAGIVGVAAALWLRRAGAEVTLIDRALPGSGTSYGNGGVLASAAIVPVTTPGLVRKAPAMALDRDYPLFLRWSYLPRVAPWLMRYLSHARDSETRRISAALLPLVSDSLEQHQALAEGTEAAGFIAPSDYSFAYADRAAYEADRYGWEIRRKAGFVPELREGAEVQARAPALGPGIGLLASLPGHGFIRDPQGYVQALARTLVTLGGQVQQAQVTGFDTTGGRIRSVLTDQGPLPCAQVLIATGVWSGPLMALLGLKVPLETERGYHILFENATGGPDHPMMISAGKFVATPMARGLRCAGLVEFGGLSAGPSRAPLDYLRRKVRLAFPGLAHTGEEEWLGHRPATPDSLPALGPLAIKGAFAAFGHQHVGLTAGPRTGRLIAGLMTGQRPNIDLAPYDPLRFG